MDFRHNNPLKNIADGRERKLCPMQLVASKKGSGYRTYPPSLAPLGSGIVLGIVINVPAKCQFLIDKIYMQCRESPRLRSMCLAKAVSLRLGRRGSMTVD